MFAQIRYMWKILSELGLREGLSTEKVRLIKTLNRVSFITACLVIPFIFPQINPTNDHLGWIELISSIGFLGAILAHSAGQLALGPIILVLTANFKIFFSASYRGFEAGEQLFFIPLFVGIILVYDLRKQLTGQIMGVISLSALILLNVTSYSLLAPDPPLSETVIREIFRLNFLICSIILISIGFYYSRLAQMQQEAILSSKEQAEKASRAKSEFLSVISHELKTPLHGLLNYIEMLKEDGDQSQRTDIISGLSDSSSRLALMVDNLLLVTEQEMTNSSISRTIFRIDAPIQQVADHLGSRIEGAGLTLKVDSSEENIMVESDLKKVEQILENLVDNAIKFSETGTITLKVSHQETGEEGKINLLYSVEDHGIGIKEEIKSRIFLPFFMYDSSLNRHTGGAGLGLSVSAGLARQLGGVLSVESKESSGSIFNLEIPANIVKQAAFPMQPAKTKELNILLVDDHPVNQKVASAMLKKLGYTYDIASNGQEAVSATESGTFHLIFMDIQMPVMDGIEATRQIRRKIEQKDQPVIIALTANTTENDRKACFDAGMNDFLAKPITKSAIGQAINKWKESIPDLP